MEKEKILKQIKLYKKLRYCLDNRIYLLVYDRAIIHSYKHFAFENKFKVKEINQIKFFTYADLFNLGFVLGKHGLKFIVDNEFDYELRIDRFLH